MKTLYWEYTTDNIQNSRIHILPDLHTHAFALTHKIMYMKRGKIQIVNKAKYYSNIIRQTFRKFSYGFYKILSTYIYIILKRLLKHTCKWKLAKVFSYTSYSLFAYIIVIFRVQSSLNKIETLRLICLASLYSPAELCIQSTSYADIKCRDIWLVKPFKVLDIGSEETGREREREKERKKERDINERIYIEYQYILSRSSVFPKQWVSYIYHRNTRIA